jgi:puromycin-sensitive aminopeptidase
MHADPYRLPRHALPTRYDVHLEPDLDRASFEGSVTVDVDIVDDATELMLNAAELTIHEVTVDGEAAPFELDEKTERVTIALSPPRLAGSSAKLGFRFTGILNDKLRGFYRSTYTDEAGTRHVIATTQMQATDCRRAFPCWDEPDFKAVFAITLTVDPDLLAISNSPETGRAMREDGKAIVTFGDTMKMSSYLVAFIVGRLEATDPVDVDGTPMRVVHVPGKGHLAQFGLDAGVAGLRFFETYYDIPYPGEKIDLVALPDFSAGAMENLGCITFRENLLLLDPETSTQSEQQRCVDVVSHELAHMWFGDLVTMRWWNGIWLNEAFATFMEVAACDDYRPDWKRWVDFSLERTAAFEVDSLAATRSVEFEVRSPEDADGMFDILTYEKGGALLRMLQQYLGEEPFRDGIRHYLRTHSYANTETGDLWDALEQVTGAPARRLMDSWIWQPGFPLVSASLDGDELVLHQQRFSYDEETAGMGQERWLVPVHIREIGAAGSTATSVLLTDERTVVRLSDPDAAIVVNAGGHGFMRVAYDDTLRHRLSGRVLAELDIVERYSLVDDAWSSVVAGRLAAAEFVRLVRAFGDERDLAVWQSIVAGLRGCSRLLDDDDLDRFAATVRALLAPELLRLGWTPQEGEDELTRKLRGLLVQTLGTLGQDEEVRRRCGSLFEQAANDPSTVDAELAAAATHVVASTGDAAMFDRYVEGFTNATTPQEQLRYLYALAEFDDEDLMRRTCEFALSGKVRTQNAPFLLQLAIANRRHGALAWRFVREHWAEANEAFPPNTIVRMVDSIKLLNREQDVADVQGFFAEHDIVQARKTLQQLLERQRINAALRARESEALAAALN